MTGERRCWRSCQALAARWRFAASSARAALLPPAGGRRPATGYLGAAVAVLGVVACVVAAAYLSLAYPGTVEVASALFIAVLVGFLAACVSFALFAPPAPLATVVARAIGRAVRRTSSDEAAVGSAGTGRTSGS